MSNGSRGRNRCLSDGSTGTENRTRLKAAADRNLDGCAEQLEQLQGHRRSDGASRFGSLCLANEAMRASMLQVLMEMNHGGGPFRWRHPNSAALEPWPHHDRETLDLIWFPQYGGKPSLSWAVLRCVSRRLSDPKASAYGTTVIAR